MSQSPSTYAFQGLVTQGQPSTSAAAYPNAAKSCWLCYAISPPYYEAIALLGSFSSIRNPASCRWPSKASLSLQSVSGQGTCVGTVSLSHQHLCNQTTPIVNSTDYLILHYDTWCACSTGLTACPHQQVLNRTRGFCVLIKFLPHLTYHTATLLGSAGTCQNKRRAHHSNNSKPPSGDRNCCQYRYWDHSTHTTRTLLFHPKGKLRLRS